MWHINQTIQFKKNKQICYRKKYIFLKLNNTISLLQKCRHHSSNALLKHLLIQSQHSVVLRDLNGEKYQLLHRYKNKAEKLWDNIDIAKNWMSSRKIDSKMKTGQGEFQETNSNTEEAAEVEVLTEVVNTWFGVYLVCEYEIFLEAAKIECSMLHFCPHLYLQNKKSLSLKGNYYFLSFCPIYCCTLFQNILTHTHNKNN